MSKSAPGGDQALQLSLPALHCHRPRARLTPRRRLAFSIDAQLVEALVGLHRQQSRIRGEESALAPREGERAHEPAPLGLERQKGESWGGVNGRGSGSVGGVSARAR
eukprot:7381618-Prymnesium_polylepis.1